jgi:uncharacterized protein
VRDAAAFGLALQLFGHTHGGMFLGLDPLAARANSGYVSAGTTSMAGLYVNNRTEFWPGFALRLGRPLTLRGGRDQNPMSYLKSLVFTFMLSMCRSGT